MAGFGLTQVLLSANLVVMCFTAWMFTQSANITHNDDAAIAPELPQLSSENLRKAAMVANTPTEVADVAVPSPLVSDTSPVSPDIGSTNDKGFYFTHPKEGERDFYAIGKRTGTDKVTVPDKLPGCLQNDASCTRPSCVREECRPWGHHYDTIYQQRLGPYSKDNVEPFQFLEIGFFNGLGYDLYREFMPQGECHSIEIACIEPGPREEGKWPWGNFAEMNPRYQQYLDENRLHCGDGNDVEYLHSVWTKDMKRADAPPLKIVVDDGAHVAEHMAQTVFFWLPRIEPRGLLIVEDIQPISEANAFRAQFLPQLMHDLHYCGDPKEAADSICFPTLFPFLASIHCEMHICVFERNDTPSKELSLEESTIPKSALDLKQCKSMLNGHW
eukprot:scaffold387_cov195-Alexandrium_tamarense.AAC.39